MMKKALITGSTGQGSSCLAELLLAKGYEVHGMIRRSSSFNTGRIDHLCRDPREQGLDAANGKMLIEIDPRYCRPAEVDLLLGCASYKARKEPNWSPKTTLGALVEMMVADGLHLAEGGLKLAQP